MWSRGYRELDISLCTRATSSKDIVDRLGPYELTYSWTRISSRPLSRPLYVLPIAKILQLIDTSHHREASQPDVCYN